MDTAYQNAKAKLEELNRKINALQAKLEAATFERDRAKRFLEDWSIFSAGSVQLSSLSTDTLSKESSHSARKLPSVKNSRKEDVAEKARELIEKAGKPMMREELFPALTESGLIIEGSDPQMVLSTMLWRMRDSAKIVRLKGGGYWLAEREYAPASYFPVHVLVGNENGPKILDPNGAVDDSNPEI